MKSSIKPSIELIAFNLISSFSSEKEFIKNSITFFESFLPILIIVFEIIPFVMYFEISGIEASVRKEHVYKIVIDKTKEPAIWQKGLQY